MSPTFPQERIMRDFERHARGAVAAWRYEGQENARDDAYVPCELMQRPEYANTGWIGVIRPTDLVPVRRARYDFQMDGFRMWDASGSFWDRDTMVWRADYKDGPDAVAHVVTEVFAWLSEPVAIAYR